MQVEDAHHSMEFQPPTLCNDSNEYDGVHEGNDKLYQYSFVKLHWLSTSFEGMIYIMILNQFT